MPIRFACPHCRQKLSVSSRKAGATGECPRCKQPLKIPELPEDSDSEQPATSVQPPIVAAPAIPSSEAESSTPATPFNPAAPPSATSDIPPEHSPQDATNVPVAPQDDPFPSFDEIELIYDTEGSEYRAPEESASHHDVIAVPRYVIYLQGGLLGVVALASFAIGLIAGGAFSSGSSSTPGLPQPCTVTGGITYVSGNRVLPDEGAVIILLPQNNQKPEERATAAGLRPGDPPPAANHQGLAVLNQLGAGYARTDGNGHFEVQLPDRGRYLMLVISQARQLKSAADIDTQDILKIGPYFDNGADLIGKQRYKLTTESVRGNRQFSVEFD